MFRAALAAALAAITVPFIAHAAFGEEAAATPTAQLFPTRTGIGVTWDTVDASAYRVERKQSTTDWQDVSGSLPSSTTTWIDESLAAGATADYRVVATTSSEPTTSAAVTAKRATETPVVGDIDVLTLYANRGVGTTSLRDETAGPVTASAPSNGSRTLTAGTLTVRLPAFFAGPGSYNLSSETAVTLTQGDHSCDSNASIGVTAVTYTADHELETLAAWLTAGTCTGATVEIRYKSAVGYQALSVTPDTLDAGRVMVGTSKDMTLTLKNTGTEPVEFGNMSLSTAVGWKLTRNCDLYLPVGASCMLTVAFQPTVGGPFWVRLTIPDSTSAGYHTVLIVGAGVSLPRAPQSPAVLRTYQGFTLAWPSWPTVGGTPVTGYVLHRYLDGQETTQQVATVPSDRTLVTLPEISPKPGMEYAVSVINEIGEGPVGPRSAIPRATDQIALTGGTPSELLAAGSLGYVVPFLNSSGSVTPKEALASAPDGRSLAYVTTQADKILWTQRVEPGTVGTPKQLYTTQAAITHLSWSPDGTRIAFQSPENGMPCVYVIAAAGGTPVKIACDLASPSWMPDGRTLIVTDRRFAGDDRFARIQAAAGGARVSTLPAPTAAADGMPVRVSPDGQQVAFGSGPNVKIVDFFSTTVLSSPPLDSTVRSISWNPDGGSLLALTGSNHIVRITLDRLGSAPAQLANDAQGGSRLDIAWQRLGMTIASTPAVVGRQATIAFDGSALMPGTTFKCSLLGPENPCTSPYTPTNLPTGESTLVITATEPDGRVTRAYRTLTVDGTGPVARMTWPVYQSSVAATATLRVTATDTSGIASYDVRYRRASFAGPYSGYVQPWTNTTATSMNLAVAAGYEYCVSVRAKDKLGNIGQWSAERCFSRPLDDRSLSMATTGWARGASSKFYLGTATQTTASGKALTRTVQGKRFFLVATRCPTCGAVAVYAGNRLLTTVKLAYPTTQHQAVLRLPVQSTLFSGTLTLRTVSAGRLVQVDGLAVGRT